MSYVIYQDTSFINEDFLKKPTWKIKKNKLEDYFEVYFSESINSKLDSEPREHQKDSIYMEMSQVWAKNSKCKRMQVGSLIVKDKSIISDGYNGTPSGYDNCCENDNWETHWYTIHAESNAILKCARWGHSCDGATLYLTHSPCKDCSKSILQSGIQRVVYIEEYKDLEGVNFLISSGIQVEKINI
jgi:dCMP deaminase